MNQTDMHAAGVIDARQQHAARLGVLVAKMNFDPSDIRPVSEALERILDIASAAPGGWNALIDCLTASKSRDDVLAFCRSFTSIVAVHARGTDDTEPVLQPVHDMEGALA